MSTKLKYQEINHDKYENAYHNINKALKIYRVVAVLIKETPRNVAAELAVPFSDFDRLIDKLDILSVFEDQKPTLTEERLKALAKSRQLLEKINIALSQLPCVPNGRQMYTVLYETYISPENLSVSEILTKLCLPKTTYFRIRKRAEENLAKFLWIYGEEIFSDIDEIIEKYELDWLI